jgi:tetratricopeptide (TPR) repeat protein
VNEHRISQLLDEARYYETHRMWLHAVQVFERLIQEFPEKLDFRIRLGNVYLEMGNLAAAELVLLQALRYDAQNPDILYALGIACSQSGDLDRALFYLQQLAARRLPNVHYSLGLIYWRREELSHAERHLRLALEYAPEHIDAALALGQTLLRQNRPEDAVTVLRELAALVPDDVGIRYTLGLALVAAAHWDGAVLTFQTVLQLDPEHDDSRLACASALMKLRRYDEAEQMLQAMLIRDTRATRALIALGRLALLKANRKKAEEYFRHVLELEPDNEEALEQLRYFAPQGKSSS